MFTPPPHQPIHPTPPKKNTQQQANKTKQTSKKPNKQHSTAQRRRKYNLQGNVRTHTTSQSCPVSTGLIKGAAHGGNVARLTNQATQHSLKLTATTHRASVGGGNPPLNLPEKTKQKN